MYEVWSKGMGVTSWEKKKKGKNFKIMIVEIEIPSF